MSSRCRLAAILLLVVGLFALGPVGAAAPATRPAGADPDRPLGPASLAPIDWMYGLMRLPRPSKHDPGTAAPQLGDTVVQYVQGTGDPWGTMEIIEGFAAKTPNALPVVHFPSTGRYEGYRYVSERVDDVVGFFREHL